MESKANPLLVGAFTVLFLVGMAAFVIWIVKLGLGEEQDRYRIVFEQSVAGLSEGARVRVSGIEVGQVEKIHLGVEKPGQVPVVIAVRADLPVTRDTFATIESLGITGATFIALHPGEGGAQVAALTAGEGEDLPTIPARPSGGLSAIMDQLPRAINDMRAIVDRVGDVLDERRMAQIDSILDNIAETTAAGPGVMQAVRVAARDAQAALVTGEQAAAEARSTFRSADRLLEEDVTAVVAEARRAASSLRDAAGRIEQTVRQAGPGIGQFADEGLTEVRYMVSEARRMVDELTQLADRLQENPNALIFGEPEATFRPGDRR